MATLPTSVLLLRMPTLMPEEMQQIAVAATKEAPRKHTVMKDVAALIKGNFEPRDNPTWDCVVSSNLGQIA